MFQTANTSGPPLQNSPSPFITDAWRDALSCYPGNLSKILTDILKFGCLLGYNGPKVLILSDNMPTAKNDPDTMEKKITDDLLHRRIVITSATTPFISSPLGFVPKPDGSWRRIHHLSYPAGRSTNDGIPLIARAIVYITLENIFNMVVRAGRGCLLIKKDIKDAFRNVPVAEEDQWLLGFMWEDIYYKECCLPFGLGTAPILFNLFAEGFHWILQSHMPIDFIFHYLDDFIFALPPSQASPSDVRHFTDQYNAITDTLGIPRADAKDATGTCITVLGVEIDTLQMVARLPIEKLNKARQATAIALGQSAITLELAESLAGFLAFCATVTQAF